ncbi:neither inactivation nor afterpotential protein C-like [Artemia franciscana]|uniref:neither inactivation nor afterpotential protein C-like n=1 Tax=Artemia franciscana TaxID=6661 RepID=UPI0032DB499B
MVVNDEIITNDNQPEVIQPPEIKKSHLISIEENSTNSTDNQLEVIVPISIVNSPFIPLVPKNDKNSSPGSIDSAKITTYHQPQITPQISCSSKDELTFKYKTKTKINSRQSVWILKSSCIFFFRNNSNFHIFYYFYFGLAKTSRLDKYYLEAEKDYNYLPTTNCTDADKYAESFIEFETLWKHFDFSKEETDFIYKTIAAILLLGEVDFDNGAIKNDGSKEVLGNVAKLLEVDAKKLEWVLLNYCVIVQGEPIRNKQTLAESYASRDSLSRILYARAFEWLVNLINMKISVTRLVFGDPHAIGLLDLFGFECAETNSYEQLIINITNEQLAFHFNQSIFSWEMQDCKQEDIDSTGYTFFDNRPILDLLLMKPEGVLAFLDEECKATGDKSMFLGSLNQFLRSKYLEVKSDTEFTVAHYTGKVTYTTDDFIVKNRDFIPQEIIELLRFSGNAVISTVFKTKVTKTGHVTTAVTFQEKTLIRVSVDLCI